MDFKTILFLLGFFAILQTASAQNVDHTNWSFAKFSFKANEKWRVDITPMHRFHKNLTTYQNSSLDLHFKRVMPHNLMVGFFSRTWLIPEQRPRQFVWFDLFHTIPTNEFPIKFNQRLRWHIGLNINDRIDSDFIRYQFNSTYPIANNKLRFFVGPELFFRLNTVNEIERLRIDYGVNIAANKNLNFFLFMRREDWFIQPTKTILHIWMTGMQYKFDSMLFKGKTPK